MHSLILESPMVISATPSTITTLESLLLTDTRYVSSLSMRLSFNAIVVKQRDPLSEPEGKLWIKEPADTTKSSFSKVKKLIDIKLIYYSSSDCLQDIFIPTAVSDWREKNIDTLRSIGVSVNEAQIITSSSSRTNTNLGGVMVTSSSVKKSVCHGYSKIIILIMIHTIWVHDYYFSWI